MEIELNVNGRSLTRSVPAGTTLLTFLRDAGFASVKQGCESLCCGLCTVWLDGEPILSCGYLAARAQGHRVTTLEGVPEEAAALGDCMAVLGGEQCGYCNPGLMMTAIAMKRTLQNPSAEEIRRGLAGNLCRCTGYDAQLAAVQRYMEAV